MLEDPTVGAVAAAVGKTAGTGHAALAPATRPLRNPEPTKPRQIGEELDIFHFCLSDDELARIDAVGPSMWDAVIPAS